MPVIRFLKSLFDIRPGEYLKTAFMSLYLMLVLFAYYILKPVSRALFLNKFDIDKLPWLYILIAGIGGTLAYLYTKLAVRSSLRRAIDFANVFCVAVLVLFWWFIQFNWAWLVYAFNIWVSLFSIMLVSQGWLVATNVYTSREAKRVYGVLGVGSVIGAAFGGSFTAFTVHYIGTRHLLLASAAVVIASYFVYRLARKASGKTLEHAKGAEEEEKFSFAEIVSDIARHRHLQVIIAIMVITFMVDVMVEFQFSAFAKQTYKGSDLTAFLGNFYGFWLNLITFVLQMFLTTFIVSRFGVGPTLQIMPVSIACASIATLLFPSLLSTAAARLTEASTRYSFNKTGTELLYLPLPLELRNRTKAFVDIFVDRLSRGLGGMVLVLFTSVVGLTPYRFAAVVLAISIIWILLSILAQREYVTTVRKRLEMRRLDLESARINATDPLVVQVLERAARGENGRQAAYALEVLADAGGYNVTHLIEELASSTLPEVRAKVYEIARKKQVPGLIEAALAEIRNARGSVAPAPAREAVMYAVEMGPEPADLSRRLLEHQNAGVRESTLEALAARPAVARDLIDTKWVEKAAASSDSRERALSATAIRITGVEDRGVLERLLSDPDSEVATSAMRAACAMKNRAYLPQIIGALRNPHLRGVAIDCLAAYGVRIIGTLSDLLEDDDTPINVQRYVPRVLQRISDQRSVDVLIRALPTKNLLLRSAVLKALNKLRDSAPNLNYGSTPLMQQVHAEAKAYFELHAALTALRAFHSPGQALSLVIRTLESRLRTTLERVFRLLGLKYPPRQIYAAFLALDHRKSEEFTAALEFLDNVLEREVKRIMLPLLDEDAVLAQKGQELFRVERKTVPAALRDLIHSGDVWLVSCAIAAAAELGIRDLAGDVRRAGETFGAEVLEVARAVEPALA
jgi:AAA family ATP:ADP antiporter